MSGSQAITHTCKDRQGNAVAAGGCDLSNFQIYGYKTTANPNPTICTHGNNAIEAFIIAPDHTAGMKGGGSNDGGVQGALWAKSWGDGGSGCNSNSGVAELIYDMTIESKVDENNEQKIRVDRMSRL